MKKLLAVLLAVLMLLSILTACGPTDEPDKSEAPSSTGGSTNSEGNEFGASIDLSSTTDTSKPETDPYGRYDETVTFTTVRQLDVGASWPNGMNVENNPYVDAVREKLNVEMELEWQSSDYGTKLDMSIISDDLPDIFWVTNYMTYIQLLENDMLEPLTDAFRSCAGSYMRDCYASFDSSIFEPYISDGELYALPSTNNGYQYSVCWIRKDWLDKLGLALPTTEAEFHDCLVAFRDNAELLLGADAAKMVPFSISTDIGWRADLLNVSKVPEDVSDETLYVYGYDDRHLLYPNYKEGIRVLNQWYNEGLIWKDFALYTDASVEDDMMKSGFVGAFIHNWDYPYRNGEDSIQANLTRANGADAGFIAVDCFQNDAGITRKYLADRIDRKVFFPATNDEPLASLLYLNFISSEETIKFLQTGKEGVTYKMTDNGAYEMLNATGEWIMNSGMNIDHTITVNGLYLGDATAATKALSYPGVNPDFIITANTYGKLNGRIVKKFSCGAISAEEDVGTSLNSKRDAMLTQAVVAPVDQFDSVYDKGMADYLASGGQNIIDERREKLEAIYGVHVD